MKKVVAVCAVIALLSLAGVAMATKVKPRVDRTPRLEKGAVTNTHLLDRGVASTQESGKAGVNAKAARAQATLMLNATNGPGATNATTYLWWSGSAVAFMGNLFQAGADYPTSWHPFDVTGVFAWHWVTGTAHWSATYLAAGQVPAGMQAGTWATPTWPGAGFAVDISGTGNIGGMRGGQGLFPAAAVPVATGGCVCGLRTYGNTMGFSQDGVGMNPGAGGNLHWAYWGATSAYASFWYDRDTGSPAFPSFSGVAGCYVNGATVPVELMAFSVE